MGYKVNKIMLGTQQVRPLKFTYTIANVSSASSSYASNAIPLYKRGYKIKSINMETSGKTVNTSYTGEIGLVFSDAASGHNNCLQTFLRVGNTTFSRFSYQYSGTRTTMGEGLGTVSSSGNNTFSMNITSEGIVTTIVNGNVNNFTLSGNGKAALDVILNGSSIYAENFTKYGTIGPTKVTVTYEKI